MSADRVAGTQWTLGTEAGAMADIVLITCFMFWEKQAFPYLMEHCLGAGQRYTLRVGVSGLRICFALAVFPRTQLHAY